MIDTHGLDFEAALRNGRSLISVGYRETISSECLGKDNCSLYSKNLCDGIAFATFKRKPFTAPSAAETYYIASTCKVDGHPIIKIKAEE
jgi:hypothetical protein